MPWMNLLIALIVIGSALIWAVRGTGRGLFSAFLAFVCAVASGAIAFGVWEMIAAALIPINEPLAYTFGLLLPFGITFGLLRLIVDSLVSGNLTFGEIPDFVGGLVFGGATGIISAGMLAIGLAHLPSGPSLLGYNPVNQDSPTIRVDGSLWIPADRLVAMFYERLSVNVFASPTPLAVHHPDVHEAAALARTTYTTSAAQGGTRRARHTLDPVDVSLQARYRIEGSLDDLRIDRVKLDESGDPTLQPVTLPDGSPQPEGSVLEGFVVRFGSATVEEGSGQFLLGPGQIRLITHNADTGHSLGLQPIAIIAPAQTEESLPTRFVLRGKDVIASVGGGANHTWGVEFLIPPGYEPIDMMAKNARVRIGDDMEVAEVSSTLDRDTRLDAGVFLQTLGEATGAVTGVAIDLENAAELDPDGVITGTATLPRNYHFRTRNADGLQIEEGNRGSTWSGGQKTLPNSAFETRGVPRNLVVSRLQATGTTGIVQVVIASRATDITPVGQSISRVADRNARFALRSERGELFEPIGYIFDEGQGLVDTRFIPGQPISAITDLPSFSENQTSLSFYVFFRATAPGVITHVVIGDRAVYELSEPIEVRAARDR
ncbi:MAG: hypothetical protein AAGI30_00625 [Planctomycetota bacterium]